ncbi:unnamed protein product [Absidia cylindrospora]
MKASRSSIPRKHFDEKWDDIIARNRGRAVDDLDFLLYVVPTLLIPKMNSTRSSAAHTAKEVLNNLIIACHLCIRWTVEKEDLEFIKTSIRSYQLFLNEQIYHPLRRMRTMTVKSCAISIHHIGHISSIIEALGPLAAFSCRSLERTIGQYKRKIYHARCLAQVSVKNAIQIQHIFNHCTPLKKLSNGQDNDSSNNTPAFSGQPYSKLPDITTLPAIYTAIDAYFERKGMQQSVGDAESVKYIGRLV